MSLFEFMPLQEMDLDLLYGWFQEPTIKQWYANGKRFSFDEIKNKYLPRILKKENIPSFIAFINNSPIGFIQYYRVTEHFPEGVRSYNNALFKKYSPVTVAGIDCFIAQNEDRGKGLGSQMINDFITGFLLDFSTIIVDPANDNTPAIRCYEKAGFERSTYSKDPTHLIMIKHLL